jgi:Family of unknown function (DUF5318)
VRGGRGRNLPVEKAYGHCWPNVRTLSQATCRGDALHATTWVRTAPSGTAARTLERVRIQRQVVDYALQRRSLLAEVYAGRVGVTEVCDANPYLLRAAKFHGRGSDLICPICRKEQLTLVSWVFGDGLGPVSGSARTAEELVRLAATQEEFSVHVVEVCRTCSWNHLVQSYVLGLTPAPKQRRSRRAAPSRRIATE